MANGHLTLISSRLGLQAAARSCGPVLVMKQPALLSLPESGISRSKHLPIKTADVHMKKGALKYRRIDKQAMKCNFLCAIPSVEDQTSKKQAAGTHPDGSCVRK